MTNIKIKDDLFFTIEKSEGSVDFPRKFYPVQVSGNQLKLRNIASNDALNFDTWSLENFQIDGVTYTDVHEAVTALLPITWNEASGESTPPIDYTPFFQEIITEIKSDDAYQLFEDTDGNVLFGKIDDEGLMKYYKPDGSEYTGDVKPYSRDVIQFTTEYCADSVPYTLIQFRDADTKEVVASVWRNDNDLTESTTAPANKVKGTCAVADLTGTSCNTPVYAHLCNVQELADAINANNKDYTAVLQEISSKQTLIETVIKDFKAENNTNLIEVIAVLNAQLEKLGLLETAILDGNIKLADILVELKLVNTNLQAIKLVVDSIDSKLTDVISNLEITNEYLNELLSELNISIEIETYEKNNGTVNYIQRETILWDNETSSQYDKIVEYSINGIDWTTEAPEGEVNLGFLKSSSNLILGNAELYCGTDTTTGNKKEYYIRQNYLFNSTTNEKTLFETEYSEDKITWVTTAPTDTTLVLGACSTKGYAEDTFQLTDCEGNPIGDEEEIIKVVQIGKQSAAICNTKDISDPIVEAIQASTPSVSTGKKQDLITWDATTSSGTLEIPAGKFSTVSLLAAKGEFTIENISNDFTSDLVISDGNFMNKIEISADGIGTESGSTDLPNSIDTRANAYDLDTTNNSYLITCVREGVLLLELYK